MDHRKCRHLKQWITGMLLAVMLFPDIGILEVKAQEERTLKVAFPESDGISKIDKYGRYTGLLVDYLDEIAKYTGWKYEYVPVDSEDLTANFLDGQYDLMGGTFYSPGFEEYFAYPSYNTGRSRAVLLCRKDNNSLLSYNLASLNGKTIGVYENAKEKIRYLEEFLKSNDLECPIRAYTQEDMGNTGNLYRQLRAGEVDMLLGNDMEIGGEFRMVTSFQAQPYYIVTTVGNTEIISGLNTALQHILESRPNFAEETYNANFPDVKMADIQLNDKELAYIQEKRTVTVAVYADMHPVYWEETSPDRQRGMLPELLEKISGFTGLDFDYVFADSYAESIQMVRDGEADMLGAYLDSEEQAYLNDLSLTEPYINLNCIVLKRKSVSYPDKGLLCGILKGQEPPLETEEENVYRYDTVSDMLEAVNKGEIDYIYGVSAMLEQEMQNHRYPNIVAVTQESNNTKAAFAVNSPAVSELLTILNKSISNIPITEKTELLNRNMISMGYTKLSLRELVYANPVMFLVVLVGTLLLITVSVLFIIRSRMMNSLMQSRMEVAEAKNLAKSEFLSQMSHEIRTPMNAILGMTDLASMEKDVPPELRERLNKIRSSSRYLLSLINDILDMSRIENNKMKIEQKNFSLQFMLNDLQEMMSTQVEEKGLQFEAQYIIHQNWIIGDPVRLRQVLTNLLSNAIKFTPPGGQVVLNVEETENDGNTAGYFFSVRDTGDGIPRKDQERIFASFEQLEASTAQSAGTGLGLPISLNIVRLMGGELQVKSEPRKGSEFFMTLHFPLGSEEQVSGVTKDKEQNSLEGMKVLLVEDNDLNAEIAQELLAIRGIQVVRAVNGQDAVDIFIASEPGEYHVILMDIRMPVMDGHEATRNIRASGRIDADIPVIAMTANSFREDREEAKAAGMNHFLSKPIDPERLFTVLQEFYKS